MNLGTKFFVLISTVILIFSIFLTYQAWTTAENHLTQQVYQEAELALSFDLAIRKYVQDVIRPRMRELVGPEDFEPETMSTSYVARQIFKEVKKDFPEIVLKFASKNPKNPENMAIDDELKIIDNFNKNNSVEDWSGEIQLAGKAYISHFRARRMEESCLDCHGDPKDAPVSLIEKYGETAGFHLPLNEVVALDSVAIPKSRISSVIIKDFVKNFSLLSFSLAILFTTLIFVFRFLVSKRIAFVEKHLSKLTQKNDYSQIDLLPLKGNDEIDELAKSFNKLAEKLQESYISLNKEIKERTLANEQLLLEINERKRFEDALQEARKTLEQRVEDRTDDLVKATLALEKEILERRLAEQKITDSYIELDQIFNTAADGMRILDNDFNVIRINDTFQEMVGLPREEIINKKCHAAFPGHSCNTPKCPLIRMRAGEKLIEEEVEKIRPDNTHIPCILVAKPYLSPDGELIGIIENFKDITSRKQVEIALKTNEEYLSSIMSTIQTGVVVTESGSGKITDINPCAAEMLGFSYSKLIGSKFEDHIEEYSRNQESAMASQVDFILKPPHKNSMVVRQSMAPVTIQEQEYTIHSLLDITDIKKLLEQQEIDIVLARNIMGMINGIPQRYIDLNDELTLFVEGISIPCNAEGGDHYFVKQLPATTQNGKSHISIKDQSGHAVNCILKSIITDLIHNTLIFTKNIDSLEEVMSTLNFEICRSALFREDDFLTSITAEIDHNSLELKYISAGHPPLLLIRGSKAISLGKSNDDGTNLPIAIQRQTDYTAGLSNLVPGDKLILYTDGLLDMPYAKTGQALSNAEFVKTIEDIISSAPDIPVSSIIKKLLQKISSRCNEEIIPYEKNTSGDDITIIGLEIENKTCYSLKSKWNPRDTSEIDHLIRGLIEKLKAELLSKGFGNDEMLNIKLALSEAVMNAWKHGNKKNPKKTITIYYRIGNDLIIEVIDQGPGFKIEKIPDPTYQRNIFKETGRGIYIIRNHCASVRWQDGGCRIIMSFKRHFSRGEQEHLRQLSKLMRLWENTNPAQKRRKLQ